MHDISARNAKMLPILTQTPHLSIVIGLPSTDDLFAGCVKDQRNATAALRSQRRAALGFLILSFSSFFVSLFPPLFSAGDKRGLSDVSFQ